MYIRFRTQDNSVVYNDYEKPLAEEREFIDLNGEYAVAECDNIPNEYDYLEVVNVQTKIDTWTEKERIEKIDEYGNSILDENGEVITKEIEVEKSRTYLACDLVAKFRPAPTQEQITEQKQKKYESLCQQYIRQKYSATDEYKIQRRYLKNLDNVEMKAQFEEYDTYVENCLVRAYSEIYG